MLILNLEYRMILNLLKKSESELIIILFQIAERHGCCLPLRIQSVDQCSGAQVKPHLDDNHLCLDYSEPSVTVMILILLCTVVLQILNARKPD